MALKREKNNNWKGGRTITSHGYVMVKVDENVYSTIANGYAYEHRYVMEKHLGRKLNSNELLHHINHNKQDNRIENLLLCTRKIHKFQHRKKSIERQLPYQENYFIKCACGCGKELLKFDTSGRPRNYSHGCNKRGTGKKNTVEMVPCKCGCGLQLNRYDKYGRTREFISGHNKFKNSQILKPPNPV